MGLNAVLPSLIIDAVRPTSPVLLCNGRSW